MPEKLSKVTRKVDTAEIFRLLDAGHSQRDIERQTGVSQGYISKLQKARRLALNAVPTNGDRGASPLPQQVEVTGEPDSAEPVQTSAVTLSDHETRLQVLESFVATLQAQALQPPVQHITVQPSADSAYALHSAETVQTWDDPEDAKPERWNLWLPRGLKRRIEAHAKAVGIPPSQLVQRLLMNTLHGGVS